MIKNYFFINLRSFWKNRSHTSVNMLGLSLGISCSILIFLIIRYELSFDNYHLAGERIYRVVAEFRGSDTPEFGAGMTYPLPIALRQDFPDPEYVTIVDANLPAPVITYTHSEGVHSKFKESQVAFVDSDYFKIFHYEWIDGNTEALRREKTVVITESTAKKYFGDESAMNKVITFNNEFDVTISGVIKDPPLNSDLPFHLLFSNRLGSNKRGWEDWATMASSINCFIKLNPGVSKEEFESKLKGWHLKYFTGDKEEEGKFRRYFLQPLSEMHFDSRFRNFGEKTISKITLLTLACIGLLLLLTACINFVNLNSVLIISRSKEVGIRKVMGSSRFQLVLQFLGETLLITFLSLLVSACLVELALIYLTPTVGYHLDFHPLSDPVTLLFLILLPIVVTLLSGLYPGLSISRFQPIKALKNKLSGASGKGITLRRSLIVFQLMVSQILVVSTIVVVQQINYVMTQPLGLNSEAVIEFMLPENTPSLLHRLRDRIKNIPGVQNFTMSNTGSISSNKWTGGFTATFDGKQISEGTIVKFANEDFVNTYQIALLHGENLVRTDSSNQFLANESLIRTLGFENPEKAIGVHIDMWGNKGMIRGIVKDFNTTSLHESQMPVLITTGIGSYRVGAVRVNTQNVKEPLRDIQRIWEEIYPNHVFEYTFLDDTIAKFYESERQNSYMIGIFAGVAIFIGSVGLFGLISFMASTMTREIGIRKILGASVSQIVGLFSKEFVMLVLLSFILSIPIAYYFMEKWLSNFPYRIHPNVSAFLLGVGVILIVVISTIGIKSYRAAVSNPIDALRDE